MGISIRIHFSSLPQRVLRGGRMREQNRLKHWLSWRHHLASRLTPELCLPGSYKYHQGRDKILWRIIVVFSPCNDGAPPYERTWRIHHRCTFHAACKNEWMIYGGAAAAAGEGKKEWLAGWLISSSQADHQRAVLNPDDELYLIPWAFTAFIILSTDLIGLHEESAKVIRISM